MPLEDATISREPDGTFNEEYCKWCYTDGEFKYESPEQLIEFCVEHMASDAWPKEQVRAHMEAVVPQLRHCKCGIPDTRAHGRSRNAARFLIDCPPRKDVKR